MKGFGILLVGPGLVSLLVGCSSMPVAIAPIGPNPAGSQTQATIGQLEVFSNVAEQSDDQNQGSTDPVWYQHTDYGVYDLHGKLVKRVSNAVGHYGRAPRRVALSAGQYLVRAQSKDYLQVEVPVTIERGRTTRVHLDDNWRPPADTPKRELVTLPNGNPVGWRVESIKEIGAD